MDTDGPRFPAAPPEQIDLGDGVALGRVRVEHAPAATRAVNASLDHLGPWMAWAKEQADESERAVFLAAGEELWDAHRDFSYLIFDGDDAVIGGCGLHGRQGPDALDIGYWVHVDHIGRGLATAVARALTDAAFEIDGVQRVRIQCEETNERSARVPEKLGYELQGIDVPEEGACAGRSTQHWQITRDRWMSIAERRSS
ncbi:MAG: GNAT family protein [Acidimicrobiales bacterium]